MPRANTEHRKLAAIMFTDMAGYSALAQRNEALALELLEEHRRLLRGILPRYQGQEIKTTGDGFLLEFSSALAAVQCGVEIQQTLADRNQAAPPERQVRIRIGIHLGDIVRSEGDVYGDGVNIAARIEPLAEPGGICVTRAVWEQVQNKLEQPLVRFGAAELKNIELPVEIFRVVLPGQTTVPKNQLPRRIAFATAGVAVGGLLIAGAWLQFHRSPPSLAGVRETNRLTAVPAAVPDQKSIAVLPFVNMSSDKENEYLSDGITEELLNALSKVPGLRVPARTSAFAFKGKNEDIRKIGELLHVGTVLEGSVRRSGDRLRITAQLIDVTDGFHVWSKQFDREMKDVFAIQDEIARTIVAELKVTLAGATAPPLLNHGTENIEAYQLYLKGRFHAERHTRENLQQAVNEFQRAVEKQPDYARAHAGLVYAYGLQQFFGYASPRDVLPRMQAAGQKAMQLDYKLADPHLMAAYGHCYINWNWKGAESSFKHAIELEPANPDTHRGYADFLTVMGRFQEALTELSIAQRIDPLSEMLKLREGWVFFRAGQNDRALEIGRQLRDKNPDDFGVRELVSFALFRKGQKAEAVAELEAAIHPGAGGLELARLGRLYGRAGKKSDAQRVLQQLQEQARQNYVPAYCLADVYEGLGEFDQANVWMTKAIENRESPLVYLKVDADELSRANPHFPAWLKKIGLD